MQVQSIRKPFNAGTLVATLVRFLHPVPKRQKSHRNKSLDSGRLNRRYFFCLHKKELSGFSVQKKTTRPSTSASDSKHREWILALKSLMLLPSLTFSFIAADIHGTPLGKRVLLTGGVTATEKDLQTNDDPTHLTALSSIKRKIFSLVSSRSRSSAGLRAISKVRTQGHPPATRARATPARPE